MAGAVALLVATVGAVTLPAAPPAIAATGTICFNESGTGWPKFPPGSIFIVAAHAWWPFPFYFPPPFGCPNNGIYQNYIQALTYVTPGSLTADMTICWRWTQLITTSTAVPSPWAYREPFLTAPSCREFGNRPPGQDGSQNAGRQIWCPTCTPAPTPSPTPTSSPTPTPALHVLPVPADYDGDGKDDIAVYRKSDHHWWVSYSSGRPSGDIAQYGFDDSVPVPADYNADGSTDFAVYRSGDHRWWINSGSGTPQWGFPGDIPVPADYDGDGRTDIAIYRPQDGHWWIAYSSGRPSGDQGSFGFPTG